MIAFDFDFDVASDPSMAGYEEGSERPSIPGIVPGIDGTGQIRYDSNLAHKTASPN